jgi:hypothetical protein
MLAGYHLKIENSLKRDDTEKYHLSIIQEGQELSFKHHSSSFEANLKNLNLNF